ncbi:hypothetical protein C2S52_008050 [Perilla frutescens var. hirtella]|nr:hypothetical protein C2S52_008050 [Perilla frutescens var. hirtella]
MFSNWLAAMGGVAPICIITDQDESIKQELHEVMPDTIHRLDKDTFETKWGEFLVEHHLENNKWLQDLFSEREKWVLVYLNHTFWVGMISTQRSEGMHAYFDEFLHSRCTLTQFMEQYEMAIGSKIQKEFHTDFDSKNRMRMCLTEYKWEAQFQKVYTNLIFHRLQDIIERMKYCFVSADEESHQAGIEKYRVLETRIMNDFFRKDYTYTVEYQRNGHYLECSCKNFEFRGLLCCHIFETLRTLRIDNVNERYIMRRWRKDVHRPCSSIFFSGGYPHMTDDYKEYQELEKYFQRCTDLAFGNKTMTTFMKAKFKSITEALEKWNNPSKGKEASQRGQERSSQGD